MIQEYYGPGPYGPVPKVEAKIFKKRPEMGSKISLPIFYHTCIATYKY